MARARNKRVKAAVESIRAFHALGRALGEGREPAAARGMIPDTRVKARRFADPKKGYTTAELDALCRLIETTQPGQDDGLGVFGRTHLIRLLGVPRGERAALQKEAVRNGWSTADLEAAIAARYGSRRAGGRRRRPPADATELLAQAEQLCEGWRRWLKGVRPPEGGGDAGPPSEGKKPPSEGKKLPTTADLPAEVRELIVAADRAVTRLHGAVAAALVAAATQAGRKTWSARYHLREVPTGRGGGGEKSPDLDRPRPPR